MSIIALASNTLSSPASAGQIEYNGTIYAATPASTQRGIIPTEQFYRLDSGYAGSNATGAQSLFGVGVTLTGSTVYEFEMICPLSKSAGTTSHTVSIGFGGTATLNNIAYEVITDTSNPSFTGTGLTLFGQFVQTASANVISGAITAATRTLQVVIKGTVSINAGGTFIPQYTLSAAPGGAYTTQAGSYIKIKPLSASGANTSVGAWA